VGSNLTAAEAFFWCSFLPVLSYLTASRVKHFCQWKNKIVKEILPAPASHTSNLHPPRRPSQPVPLPHFFCANPAPVWKKHFELINPQRMSNMHQNQADHSFYWQLNQNISTHLIYRRFEAIKTTFRSSCDQVCVKRCLIHLEGLLDWIIPHQVRR